MTWLILRYFHYGPSVSPKNFGGLGYSTQGVGGILSVTVPATPHKENPQTPVEDNPMKRTPKKSKSKKRKRSKESSKKRENSPVNAKEEASGNVKQEKVLFQRLWSDEDEIALMKGMIVFLTEKGVHPTSNTKDFHDFVKGSLRIDVDQKQVRTKMRKLKERFNNSFAKKSLSTHDEEVKELGLQIWGEQSQAKTSEGNRIFIKREANDVSHIGGVDLGIDDMVSYLAKPSTLMNLDESQIQSGLKMCDGDVLAEIGEEWKMIRAEELDVNSRKMGVCMRVMKMVAAALR